MSDRKKDHIDLALKSQLNMASADARFNYEPYTGYAPDDIDLSIDFLGKKLQVPLWVSSMTGGTDMAENINNNLARACNEFGMGMGLGSCRIILDDNTWLHHFNVRHILGDEQPLYANLGIAQIEGLIHKKETEKIIDLVQKLKADGLFVHINPIQEYLQPEGDKIKAPPSETIQQLIETTGLKIIVKEVGQGMGPASLKSILNSGVAGIEFGAFGGTNFAKLELMRSDAVKQELLGPLANIGHTAIEMLDILNHIKNKGAGEDKHLIISGGIKNFLDGYYLLKKSKYPAVYGQASMFLKYAMTDYEPLKTYILYQIKGLQLAHAYLTLKNL